MKIHFLKEYKSIPQGMSFEVSDFCVLTGRNGSGKTHLLEAMQTPSICQVFDKESQLSKFQYVGFGGLSPNIQDSCKEEQIVAQSRQLGAQIIKIQQKAAERADAGARLLDPLNGLDVNTAGPIKKLMSLSGKDLMDLTEDDVFFHLEGAIKNNENLFFSQIAILFKTYHARKIRNKFKKFLAMEENDASVSFLTDDEFHEKYGPAPWDMVNEILRNSGLAYRINSPEGTENESSYLVRLFDDSRNIEIGANDLSTGEKVLMSLALAIYNSDEEGAKPDCLLLDEPDAPLHPEFSGKMMEVIFSAVFKKAGVRVILTTHSPTTVAVSPVGSVFLAQGPGQPIVPISVADGLDFLASGIPHLRVRVEKRRQIFVEGQNDVRYYSRLFGAVGRLSEFDFDPVFLEPHGNTPNCTDAIRIARSIHEAGGDNVRALVDYDLCNIEEPPVYVFGEGSRYSIENFILDPIYVFLALVKEWKVNFSDAGISSISFYPNAGDLKATDIQKLISWVLEKVGVQCTDNVEKTLLNGEKVEYPKAFLEMKGHDYEQLLIDAFPELGALARGQGEAALKLEVLKVIEELPGFLDSEVEVSFQKLA